MLTAEELKKMDQRWFFMPSSLPSFRPLALGLRSLHVLITVGVIVKFGALIAVIICHLTSKIV